MKDFGTSSDTASGGITTGDRKPSIAVLIERLEKVRQPHRDLDWAICDFLSGRSGWSMTALCPRYTESIDAALRLVPPHHLWELKQGIECRAIVWRLEEDYDDKPAPTGYSTVYPALALCIAALRARGV